MIKHTYNIVCEETTLSLIKIKHFIKIETVSFDECIKKYKEQYESWEIIEVVRL